MDYKGYRIVNALPTGGKAGKGHNKTSTIQVLDRATGRYRTMLKMFRYTVAKPCDRDRAVSKAMAWIDERMLNEAIDLLCKQGNK